KEYDSEGITFDVDRFLRITSPLVFPYEARTSENLKLIAQMGTLYGITPEKMRIQVGHYCDEEKREFNPEGFRYSFYYLQLSEQAKAEDPYELPPVAFLASKMNGAQVSAIDRKLLDHLVVDMQLPSVVINVLVEYVLNLNNNNLSKAYVDKVASQWKRSNVHTKEEAMAMCNSTKKSTGTPRKQVELPEYYKREDQGREWTQNTLSEEEKAMMAEMAKKLGG
ncbi:MAG: DnaD domain protein, partial [Erysipelotrichaceae bacterium]|nr:DnaD domain protein [Erysipelotrichaceae bacterium]